MNGNKFCTYQAFWSKLINKDTSSLKRWRLWSGHYFRRFFVAKWFESLIWDGYDWVIPEPFRCSILNHCSSRYPSAVDYSACLVKIRTDWMSRATYTLRQREFSHCNLPRVWYPTSPSSFPSFSSSNDCSLFKWHWHRELNGCVWAVQCMLSSLSYQHRPTSWASCFDARHRTGTSVHSVT